MAARTDGRSYRQAVSSEELLRTNVQAIHDLDRKASAPRTLTDRVAGAIETFASSPAFIWLHVVWFAVWIGLNVLPVGPHFDAFPFTFLTLVVSLEAIFLSAFILMSQNLSAKMSERRDQLDLQINLLSEQENTKMLQLLSSIAQAVGAQDTGDPTIEALEEATRPEKLAEQIEAVMEEKGSAASATAPG